MRLLFCLFADSIGLLPDHLFRQMIELRQSQARQLHPQAPPALRGHGHQRKQLSACMIFTGSTADSLPMMTVFDLTSADMGTSAPPPRWTGQRGTCHLRNTL
jgi:hypothetical protein